ncbi:MAG: hypothetical protein HND47_11335 [Chloroflexi bacterium]|nr:hypothetical protein [Chloroflexota bacterium]
MADQSEIESLYREAQSALKAKDYDRASGLLKRILVIDENYKDASRLLAQIVKLRRRRWFNHPLLWGMIGLTVLFALGFIIAPRMKGFIPVQPSLAVVPLSPTVTLPPTAISTATETLLPTPTPVPFTWKRISLGQEFPRDTITAFAVDRNDPDVIYASMDNAGIYKSIDGGLSWQPSHRGLSNTQVMSLVIDFQNPSILYAGTMDGIYKTEDGGGNWSRVGDGTLLLMDHQDSAHLYARDENGIYESTDRGSNWEMVHSVKAECPRAIGGWAVHPLDGNSLFAGNVEECGAGIFRSDDGGRTWNLIEMKGKTSVTAFTILLDEQGETFIFANTGSILPEHRGLFVSFDMGKNWRRHFVTGCSQFFPDPEDSSIIYCPRFGLYAIYVDEGALRRLGLNTMPLSAVHVDHIQDNVRILAGGTRGGDDKDEGLFISIDGGATWTRQSNGLASAQAELKIDPYDAAKMYLATYFYYSYEQASCVLYRSQDTGKNWSEIYSTKGWCGPSFDPTGSFYLADNNALQMTWDDGDHWLWDGPGYLGPYSLPITSQSISANPEIDGLIYAVGREIYYSEHAGKLWQPASGSEGLWDARLFYKDQGQTVFAIGRYHQAHSADGGRAWRSCGEDVTASRSDSRLALDLQGSRLYLATPGNGVLISTDSCQSWQASNQGLGNLFVNTLAVDANNPDIIYAGTDGGAYISFDSSATWNQINGGLLGATVVYSIVVDKDSNVYAATPYGIFKLESK